jgi:hypothetical protein
MCLGALERFSVHQYSCLTNIGHEEIVSYSSDYSNRWLAMKLTFNIVLGLFQPMN